MMGRPFLERVTRAAAAVLVLLAAPSAAPAITDEEIYRLLQVPLTPPGVRAAAMGGANLAVTESASAARLNPARLTALSFPQIVVEGRNDDPDATTTSSGLLQSAPAVNPFAGTSLTSFEEPDGDFSPAFIAYAHPIQMKRPLVLAAARTELLSLSATTETVGTSVPTSAPVAPDSGDIVTRTSQGSIEADIDVYDLAAGWRLSPSFSIGVSAVIGTMDLSALTTGLLSDPLQFTVVGMVDPRFSGSSATPLTRTTSDGSDTAMAFSFGSYWRAHPTLVVAAAYRQGPSFTFDAASEDLSSGTRQSFDNTVKIPDIAAAGLAWTPFSRNPSSGLQSLTSALDVERVEYSDRLEDFAEGQSIITSPIFVGEVSHDAEDETEVRIGGEYSVSFASWTLDLRAGFYTQHPGAIRLSGASGDPSSVIGLGDALTHAEDLEDEGTMEHYTLGGGARFYAFSFGLAADISDGTTSIVAGLTYDFK